MEDGQEGACVTILMYDTAVTILMYDTAVTIRRSTCAHVWKMVKRVWWQWNSSRRCPMICMRLAASARAWCRISETPTTCEAPTLCETPTMCETPLLLEHLRAGALARRVGKQGVYQRAGPLQAPWLSGYIRSIYQTPLLLLIIIIKKVIYRYIYRAQEGAAFRLEGQDGGGAGLIRRGRRDTWLCRPPATLHLMYDTSVTILMYNTAVTIH